MPSKFPLVALEKIARIFAGSSAPQDRRYFAVEGPCFIRVRDVSSSRGDVLTQTRDCLSLKAIVELPLVKAKKGTVVFPKSGAAIATNNRSILGVDGYIVSHLMALEADRELVCPEWIFYALRCVDMMHYANNPSYPSLKVAAVKKIKIPLPPLSEQRRIVARLRQELQNCDEICRAAESRVDRIHALFSAWVRIIFDKFERASWVKFSDIAEINPRRGSFEGRLKNEEMATFIPMSAVDSTAGEVSSPLVRPFSKVCKGYTFFRNGDVLFAKITPCMQNGNHFVAKNGINGFGFASTEFYVIRSGNMVLPEWIHLFIRQPSILRAAMRQFRGSAGQQRVPSKFLADLRIPLPPIPRQRRIVAQARDQFQDWQKLTVSANTQLESARALPQAILRRAFS